nr:MAG TPA: hypothetical protein [Caudoviricetes sp.]
MTDLSLLTRDRKSCRLSKRLQVTRVTRLFYTIY